MTSSRDSGEVLIGAIRPGVEPNNRAPTKARREDTQWLEF